MQYETIISDIVYSNNKQLLQPAVIHNYLSRESYWAKGIPLSVVQAGIEGSDCFAAYQNDAQIAFARVITDHATFGYLADVFVLDDFRGKGISKAIMRFIMDYPPYKGFRRFMLATKDAHGLYEQYGFKKLSAPERFMEIKPFENYDSG